MAVNEPTGESHDSDVSPVSDGKSVEIHNMTKTFNDGEVIAAQDINLTIEPDEFVVFLGPSGCGKTTTMRCISGLEIPDAGEIRIDGENVTDAKPKDRDLAFVFQSIALFPHMSVRDNMKFGLDMKTDFSEDVKEERIREAAEVLGIPDLLDRKPSALSGGQQQRVALGRAMVMEPVAFLLDEPFSALDAKLRDQMQTEIKQLQRELQRPMVFVTHDQEEAMSLGDKIVVMDNGEIQQVGSPYDIYNDPVNQFVGQFIGSPSINMLECCVEERDGDVVLANDSFSIEVTPDQAADLESVVGDLVQVGIRPENLVLGEDEMFTVRVTLIEPQGSRDVVYLENGDVELRATTGQGEVDPGGEKSVSFAAEDIFVFDQSGGRVV